MTLIATEISAFLIISWPPGKADLSSAALLYVFHDGSTANNVRYLWRNLNFATCVVKSPSWTIPVGFILACADSVFPMALAVLVWAQSLSIANHRRLIFRLWRVVMDGHLPHPPEDPKSYIAFYTFYPLDCTCLLCCDFRSELRSRPIRCNSIPYLQSRSPRKYWTLGIQVLWSKSIVLFSCQPCLFLNTISRLALSLRAPVPRTLIISSPGPETQRWFTKPSSTCKRCPNILMHNFWHFRKVYTRWRYLLASYDWWLCFFASNSTTGIQS